MPEHNTSGTDDWTDLESLWVEDSAEDIRIRDLTQSMQQRARRRRWLHVAEVILPLGILALALSFALEHSEPLWWVVTAYAAVTCIAGWSFRLVNRYSTAQSSIATPIAVLEAARKELQARGRALLFGWVLLATHMVFFGFWVSRAEGSLLLNYLWLMAWIVPFVAIIAFAQRRVRRETRELEQIERQLAEGQTPEASSRP